MKDVAERFTVQFDPSRNGFQYMVMNKTLAPVAACALEEDATAFAQFMNNEWQRKKIGDELAFTAGQIARYGLGAEDEDELHRRIERWNAVPYLSTWTGKARIG